MQLSKSCLLALVFNVDESQP